MTHMPAQMRPKLQVLEGGKAAADRPVAISCGPDLACFVWFNPPIATREDVETYLDQLVEREMRAGLRTSQDDEFEVHVLWQRANGSTYVKAGRFEVEIRVTTDTLWYEDNDVCGDDDE